MSADGIEFGDQLEPLVAAVLWNLALQDDILTPEFRQAVIDQGFPTAGADLVPRLKVLDEVHDAFLRGPHTANPGLELTTDPEKVTCNYCIQWARNRP